MTDTTEETEARHRTMSDRAREAAGSARDLAETQARQAKSVVAQEVGGVAHALRKAADDLREGSAQERTFAQIADTLADVSETIRGKDVGEIVHEANEMARRHPLTFLGGAALLGFTAVRVAKAGAGHDRANGSGPDQPSVAPGATPGGSAG